MNETQLVQPDFEIRIFRGDEEIGMFGLFFDGDETVDVGIGISPDVTPDVLAAILSPCFKALSGSTTWYDRSGLDKLPTIRKSIEDGRIS